MSVRVQEIIFDLTLGSDSNRVHVSQSPVSGKDRKRCLRERQFWSNFLAPFGDMFFHHGGLKGTKLRGDGKNRSTYVFVIQYDNKIFMME